jgi:hypothetical protein
MSGANVRIVLLVLLLVAHLCLIQKETIAGGIGGLALALTGHPLDTIKSATTFFFFFCFLFPALPVHDHHSCDAVCFSSFSF